MGGSHVKVTLPDDIELTLPDLHCMVLGVPNSGKSVFAASAETPMVVLATDPFDKMQAYHDRGLLGDEIFDGPQGQPIQLVRSVKTGKPIIQIEGYYDEERNNPKAFTQLDARIEQIAAEVKQGRWRTVVIDSWTQLEWIARQRRTAGPFANGVDSPYLSAMDDLKSLANARLMNLRCNVIVTFHIETKVVKDKKGAIIHDAKQDVGGGEMSYNIQAIGQLKNLGNIFGECYLAVAPVDGSENYYLQTRRDYNFKTLCSRKGAPNPCRNNWNDLFGPWIIKEAEKVKAQRAAANGAAQPPPQAAQEGVEQ